MSISEETTPPEIAVLIKEVCDSFNELSAVSILEAETYLRAVERLEKSVKALAEKHRNWNPVTQEPDGIYGYDGCDEDELPKGCRLPEFGESELTGVELLTNEIVYELTNAKLSTPTLDNMHSLSRLQRGMGDLFSFHPNYSYRSGMIETEEV